MARHAVPRERAPFPRGSKQRIVLDYQRGRSEGQNTGFAGAEFPQTLQSAIQDRQVSHFVVGRRPPIQNMRGDDEKPCPAWVKSKGKMGAMGCACGRTVCFMTGEKPGEGPLYLFLHTSHHGPPQCSGEAFRLRCACKSRLNSECIDSSSLNDRRHYAEAKKPPIANRQRALNRREKLDFDMPEAVFLEASSLCEVLDTTPVRFKRLPLHANCLGALSDLNVAQRLADGRGGPVLFGPALTPCFGFLSLAHGVDPASSGGLRKHDRRHGAPKPVCAIILRPIMR